MVPGELKLETTVSDTLGLVGVVLFFVASAWFVWAVVGLVRPAWMPPLSPKKRLPGFLVAVLITGALATLANFFGNPSTTTPPAIAQADTTNCEIVVMVVEVCCDTKAVNVQA